MNEVIPHVEIPHVDQIAGVSAALMENMAALIAAIAIGLIIGLFGLKLVRVWAALIGVLLGAAAASAAAYVAGLSDMAFLGAAAAGAALFAVLACIFYKIGIFFFMLFTVAGATLAVTGADSVLFIGIALALGLIIAVVTIKIFDPLVIIITSIEGGIMAGSAAISLVGLGSNVIAAIVVPLALAILCGCVQFIMRSRQLGKKQAKKADELRKKASRENEVEQARMLLDEELESGDEIIVDEEILDEDFDEEEFLDDDLEEEEFLDDDLDEEEFLDDDFEDEDFLDEF